MRLSGFPVGRWALALCCASALASCRDRATPSRRVAGASAASDTAVDTTSATVAAWDDSYGDGLLVPSASPATALGVSPDTSILGLSEGARVMLLSRDGHRDTAHIGASNDDADGCSGLPAWHLADPPARGWTVGFSGATVEPLPLDSLGSLSRADSAAIASAAARLASALPESGHERFAGLPFVPDAIWRLRSDAGASRETDVVILVRRVNQEAQPLEERTFLVIERRAREATLGYEERSQGNEEQIETRDLLAAVRLGSTGTVSLVVAHDYGNALAYSLLQRDDDGAWHVRWTSARTAC